MVEKVARSISCLALMEEIMNIIYENGTKYWKQ